MFEEKCGEGVVREYLQALVDKTPTYFEATKK
jgi:hypothetical protein